MRRSVLLLSLAMALLMALPVPAAAASTVIEAETWQTWGEWQIVSCDCSGGQALQTVEVGAWAETTVTIPAGHSGTVQVVGYASNIERQIEPYVDGVSHGVVSWASDSPNYAYPIWTSPTLPAGTHTIRTVYRGPGGIYGYLADYLILDTWVSSTPAAPTGLQAYAASDYVRLSWSPVPMATSYRIYRDGQLVGETESTSWQEAGLQPTTEYTYTVTAVNSVGEGAGAHVTVTTQQRGPLSGISPDLSGLGPNVTSAVGVMLPIWLVAAGIVLAGITLDWALRLLRQGGDGE